MYKSFTKNHKRVINRALINLTPLLRVKQLTQKKKRSSVKEFPYIIKSKNRITLALKFFINKTSNKSKIKTHKTLFTELLTAVNNSGTNVSKKKSLYEYAFIKKKYFYYRWF
jgi:ribosomal protein S7